MMKDPQEYINSGILEEYVLGLTSETENQEVEQMVSAYPEIGREIGMITASLMAYGETIAPEIDPALKPLLIATIDYSERLKNGEAPAFPPELNEQSRISDFEEWISRPDMTLPEDFDLVHVKLLGAEPNRLTGLLWLKYGFPEETHQVQYEKFLILEGTCDITIEGEVTSLKSGDYLQIPLYKKHNVTVTSSVPCKAILQRIAA